MSHFEYLALLGGGWLSLVFVDARFACGILRRWKRLAVVVCPCLALFLAWDTLGVQRSYWRSDPHRVAGLWILPGVPIEEVVLLAMISCAALILWQLVQMPRRGK